MTISYENLVAEQTEQRAAFGQMLRRWRVANDWNIFGPSQLAETHGFRPVPYGIWQRLERGIAGELQSTTFMALGELNDLSNIVPLGDQDGVTTRWGATEFWACYCGLHPVPEQWR